MKIPNATPRTTRWHRLLAEEYSIAELADEDLPDEDLRLLAGATNSRSQAELFGMSGINIHELVYGVPHAHIINGAFTHTSPSGGRFNDRRRGAWYAADEIETAVAEVGYHKSIHLMETEVPDSLYGYPDTISFRYYDWTAVFHTEFRSLYPPRNFRQYLQAGPVPSCYADPQKLARRLLQSGANGILYPSVRRTGQECLVCFRPALVSDVKRGVYFEIEFRATTKGYRTTHHAVR